MTVSMQTDCICLLNAKNMYDGKMEMRKIISKSRNRLELLETF